MENFYTSKFLDKVWGLVLIVILVSFMACNEVGSDDTVPSIGKDKCYTPESSWAIGLRFTTDGKRAKYIEIPAYDVNNANGAEIKWVYLESSVRGKFIGAVKVNELLEGEVPQGASPGDFVKLRIRIDVDEWTFVPEITNVKIGGFNLTPPDNISPDELDIHTGTATQKTGAGEGNWEYYEVVLSRYLYYSVYVESQYEVACVE
ncbi:hypothetical protein KZP23_00895 [Echinicola marina]|uniref:hypothetical protein n=1 Tax=Echinicola marina TaxID=2859768 RepID=UPI001CF6B51F|nr:hypothetical protein [Echinicola marina]UCS93630.1 hypothetical protein KZP23_00895 [Echinicola marina]